jgi:hypothetical protein
MLVRSDQVKVLALLAHMLYDVSADDHDHES